MFSCRKIIKPQVLRIRLENLIVDDEKDTLLLLDKQLTTAGYAVITADSFVADGQLYELDGDYYQMFDIEEMLIDIEAE